MMNQLTERNLEIWKEFQQTLVGGMGRSAGGAGGGTAGGAGAGPGTGAANGGKTPRGS
jgi:hypothetical protein